MSDQSQTAELSQRKDHVDLLRARLTARATRKVRIAELLELLAPELSGDEREQSDIRGIVANLCRGLPYDRVPDTTPGSADTELLSLLYRTGLGRVGPRFGVNRVMIAPTGAKSQPIAVAVQADNDRLLLNVTRALAAKTEEPGQSYVEIMGEIKAGRRQREAADIETAQAEGNRQHEARKTRVAKVVADAALPITRNSDGKIVLADTPRASAKLRPGEQSATPEELAARAERDAYEDEMIASSARAGEQLRARELAAGRPADLAEFDALRERS